MGRSVCCLWDMGRNMIVFGRVSAEHRVAALGHKRQELHVLHVLIAKDCLQSGANMFALEVFDQKTKLKEQLGNLFWIFYQGEAPLILSNVGRSDD